LTSVRDALSRTTTMSYDGAGRLTRVRDPLGRVSTAAYDVMDRLTAVTDALGGSVQLAYDANGKLSRYIEFYNKRRPHRALDGATPDAVYFASLPVPLAA
jgi:YD repeat-containing protein